MSPTRINSSASSKSCASARPPNGQGPGNSPAVCGGHHGYDARMGKVTAAMEVTVCEQDEEELSPDELRRWVLSLTEEELYHALTFTFYCDGHQDGADGDNNVKKPCSSCLPSTLMTHRRDRCGCLPVSTPGPHYGSGFVGCGQYRSHEFDLLLEMVRLQTPPPTPIHPRAIPYKPATCRGATDGREEADVDCLRRLRRDRRDRPRMLQLIEQQSLFSCDEFSASVVPGDLLCSLGIDIGSAKVEGKQPQRLQQRSKQRRSRNRKERLIASRWEVVARTFVSPWGESLGVGSTEDQRNADDALIQSTRIAILETSGGSKGGGNGTAPSSARCSLCLADIVGQSRFLDCFPLGEGSTCAVQTTNRVNTAALAVIDLLKLASRGKFLSRPHGPVDRCVYKRRRPTRKQQREVDDRLTPPFCAPWFAFDEWFTLPMYLSSRFEVALRDAYRRANVATKANNGPVAKRWMTVASVLRPTPWPLEAAIDCASSKDTVVQCLLQAYRITCREHILKYKSPSTDPMLRDLLLFKMLESSPRLSVVNSGGVSMKTLWPGKSLSNSGVDVPLLLESLFNVPLTEIGHASDTFRSMVRRSLEVCLAGAAESELLRSIDVEKEAGVTTRICNGTASKKISEDARAAKPKGSKKKKKGRMKKLKNLHEQQNGKDSRKKKQNRLTSDNGCAVEQDMLLPQPVEGGMIDGSDNFKLAFLDGVRPSEEDNMKIVLALTVVEEILDKVFQKVGLATNTEFLEEDEVVLVHKHKKKRTKNLTAAKDGLHVGSGVIITDARGLKGLVRSSRADKDDRPFPPRHCVGHKPVVATYGHNRQVTRLKKVGSLESGKHLGSTIPSPAAVGVGNVGCGVIRKGVEENLGPSLSQQQVQLQPRATVWQGRVRGIPRQLSDSSLPFVPRDDFAQPHGLGDGGECRNSHDYPIPRQCVVHDIVGASRARSKELVPGSDVVDVPTSLFDLSSSVGVSLDLSGAFDGWRGVKPVQREKSLFAEFFMDEKKDNHQLVASSTAASIASSSGEDDDREKIQVEDCDVQLPEVAKSAFGTGGNGEVLAFEGKMRPIEAKPGEDHGSAARGGNDSHQSSASVSSLSGSHVSPSMFEDKSLTKADTKHVIDSPPAAPPTPPPQLSPILVSLADLGELRKQTVSDEMRKELTLSLNKSLHLFSSGSVPSSPKLNGTRDIKKTWSRENLTSLSVQEETRARDGKVLSRQADALLSARKSCRVTLTRANSVPYASDKVDSQSHPFFSPDKKDGVNTECKSDMNDSVIGEEFEVGDCAASESAMEGDRKLEGDVKNKHKGFDHGISKQEEESPGSFLKKAEEDESVLREERNAYRDMCLTLGAEVSKLRNMLATERSSSFQPSFPYSRSAMAPFFHVNSSFDPEFMPPFFHGAPTGHIRTVAMSDAGVQRGDHDSIRSEDCTDLLHGSDGNNGAGKPWRHPPTETGTLGDSDVSLDLTAGQFACSGFRPLEGRKIPIGPFPFHGLHSRLSSDLSNFLEAISSQLKKNDRKRTAAITRLNRMVTALWPRAQVKLYGSHVTNLCLPSSDLDFVVCLPAVHKNAPAVAPGVLEGRNAINESCQKVLARNLKGESWIDPKTIKIIERTAVPVIKVSTKDVKARVLQLDISFDGPEHHGLEAIDMVVAAMEEFPMLRPLVLVLKQFLLDRGLLTAYTGGLSSYGLFLMVTRYLQEQSSSWSDYGSLLMGFLDFYGNNFDPSVTGISVRRRQYFSRQHYAQAGITHENHEQVWSITQQQPHQNSGCGMNSLTRRHSFNADEGKGPHGTPPRHGMKPPRDADDGTPPRHGMKPPRGHRASTSQHNFHPHVQPTQRQLPSAPCRPYTFDPLFVEDPLNAGNNVGRNAFRIFQIMRAFADAHRALVASLEWDISTGDMNEDCTYPLLKCLLQNEDIFIQ